MGFNFPKILDALQLPYLSCGLKARPAPGELVTNLQLGNAASEALASRLPQSL
jgi:hypothetical protein